MATDDIISSDDLEFIQRAEGLQRAFGKLRKAKTLILEARAEINAVLGKTPTPKKAAGKKTKSGSVEIEFGVDVPNALTANEKAVLAELQKGPKKPRELVEATKLGDWAVKRATKSLAARKLISATGKTMARTWKVK